MYLGHMDRRATAAVAANIVEASAARGVPINKLANATGIPAVTIAGNRDAPELTFGDLQAAGGVLSVSPATVLAGVPSA